MKQSGPFKAEFGNSSERGSGLLIIFIAIILFSILTYAISQGGSGTKNISDEKIRIMASEIIDTGNRLAETVSRMKLRGIAEGDISFENSGTNINASCSTDECKIFKYDGGGLDVETAPAGSTDGRDWGYTTDLSVKNIGTAAADLIAILPGVDQDVCHRIDVLLGISAETDAIPVVANHTANSFSGTYNGSPVELTESTIDGQKSGCVTASSAGGSAYSTGAGAEEYFYYQVLITR